MTERRSRLTLSVRRRSRRAPQNPPDRGGQEEHKGTDMTNVDVILKEAVGIDGAVAALEQHLSDAERDILAALALG